MVTFALRFSSKDRNTVIEQARALFDQTIDKYDLIVNHPGLTEQARMKYDERINDLTLMLQQVYEQKAVLPKILYIRLINEKALLKSAQAFSEEISTTTSALKKHDTGIREIGETLLNFPQMPIRDLLPSGSMTSASAFNPSSMSFNHSLTVESEDASSIAAARYNTQNLTSDPTDEMKPFVLDSAYISASDRLLPDMLDNADVRKKRAKEMTSHTTVGDLMHDISIDQSLQQDKGPPSVSQPVVVLKNNEENQNIEDAPVGHDVHTPLTSHRGHPLTTNDTNMVENEILLDVGAVYDDSNDIHS